MVVEGKEYIKDVKNGSSKYLVDKVFSEVRDGSRGSHFWQGLVHVNEIFQRCVERMLEDGGKLCSRKIDACRARAVSRSVP